MSSSARKIGNNNDENQSIKKKFKMPDVYIIMFILLIICTVATYIIPAGMFERTETGLVVPGSFTTIEQSPVGLIGMFTALHAGMVESADIMFLVLFTGGAFAVIEYTGAVKAGITVAVAKSKKNKFLVVAFFTLIFALSGALGVITVAAIAFVPVGIMLAKALKLDALIGVAIVFIANSVGFAMGFLNPKTLGLAQEIAGLPMFSGLGFRVVIFIIFYSITLVFFFYYIKKITKDPSKSLMADNPFPDMQDNEDEKEIAFTIHHKIILGFFIGIILFYVYGVYAFDWGTQEMSAIFIIAAVFTSIVAKIKPDEFVKVFVKGMQGLVYGVMLIGLARAVSIVLIEGQVLDTVVAGLAMALESLPTYIGAIAIFFASMGVNFFVGSGSGQAALTIPILAPLSDLMGIARQTTVLAFQLGDGFTNFIYPTSGVLLACLAIAKIPYTKWFRFALNFSLWLVVFSSLTLVVAVFIGYN